MAMDRETQLDMLFEGVEAQATSASEILPSKHWIQDTSSDLNKLVATDGARSTADVAPAATGFGPMAVGAHVLWEGTDANDIHLGDDSEDEMHGKGGDDSLVGGAGNDTLDGGEAGVNGNTLEGGTGNDTYYIYNTKDKVREFQDQGFDHIYTTVSYAISETGVDKYIEVIEVNPLQTQGVTIEYASHLIGGIGNDSLRFGASMNGGAGDDTYYVAGGTHQVIADSSGNDEIVVFDGGFTAFTLAAGLEIELITLKSSTSGTGNELANHIIGEGGNNVLDGGVDNLADTLEGGGGNDLFKVRSANDIVTEKVGEGTDDVVQAFSDVTLAADSEVERIQVMPSAGKTNFNIVASKYTKMIVSGDGDDVLDSGPNGGLDASGNPIIIQIQTGLGNDEVHIRREKAIAVDFGGSDIAYAHISTGIGIGIETLQGYSGVDGLTLSGSFAAEVINGNERANTIIGSAEIDTLAGGDGNDVYNVDNAEDAITENAGEGFDTIRSTANFTLGSGYEIEGLEAADNSDLTLVGNALANTITGKDGKNILNGGNDTVRDLLIGGKGDDAYTVRSQDEIDEKAGEGRDVATALGSFALGADAEVEVLQADAAVGNVALTGSKFANTILGAGGNDTLDGGGTSSDAGDSLSGGAGDDVYHVHRAGDVVTETGLGDSDRIVTDVSYTIAANVETLEASASAGNVTLTGNAVANTLIGAGGDDVLIGAGGADKLEGRGGNDTYELSDPAAVVVEAEGGGSDTIRTSFHYALAADAEIETLQATGSGAVNLTGNAFANTLIGNDAANILDGGEGGAADVLRGHDGNDVYHVRHSGDAIEEDAAKGTDTVVAYGDYTLSAGASLEVLEAAAGTASARLAGNELANTITGASGNDTLDGGVGGDNTDLLQGKDGDDTYHVRRSGDVVKEDGTGHDTIVTDISLAIAANVEVLQASETAGSVTLTGSSSAETLIGAGGDDTLVGAGGADRLEGQAGDDTYEMTDAAAVVVEAMGGGSDTIRTAFSYTLASDAEIETLQATGAAAVDLTGNTYANTLIGNEVANVLDGGEGGASDVLRGHAGNDTYHIRHAGDSIEEEAGDGTDTVVAYGHYTLGAGESLEVLEAGSGSGAVSLAGNELANTIVGAAGNDSLDGGAGGPAADVLEGKDGDDTYHVRRTSDLVKEEGTGHDTIVTDVSLTIAANVEVLQASDDAGSVTLTGSGGAETLIGAGGDDTLAGMGGTDLLEGRGGDDTYRLADASALVVEGEGAGHDTVETAFSYALAADAEIEVMRATGTADVNLTGNHFANELIGNSGNNVLDGGAGSANVMRGGLGDDTYHIRNAGDAIVEASAAGADKAVVYASFTLGKDESIEIIEADASTDGVALTGNNLANTVIGAGGNDTLSGGGASKDKADSLAGGDGDDTYYVNRVTDVVTEDDGVLSGLADRMVTSVDNTIAAHVEILRAAEGEADIALTGSDAGETLIGNAGGNILRGGAGVDTMQGGRGDDIFYVDAEQDRVEEVDANEFDTVIVTEAVSYTLSEDMLVEELRAKSGVAVQTLTGNSRANILIADAGNNTLIGGGGGDVLQGGVGNDTYHISTGDKVVEKGGQGSDTAVVNGSFALDDDASIEVLRAADGIVDALSLTGSSFDNTIIGGGGNDVIDGRAGLDRMEGGLGDDTYIIRNIASSISEAAGEGTDTAVVSVSYSLVGKDHVENLTAAAGAGSVRLMGNNSVNTITGNEGNNMISGGLGADIMAGMTGDDFYEVDEENDIVEEDIGGGNDTIIVVKSGMSFTLTEAMHVEQLWAGTGVEVRTLAGNSRANILIADLGDNTLDGGGGADRMQGGQGNDTYMVENARDEVVETNASGDDAGGNDTVVTSINYGLGDFLENLTAAAGSGDLRLTGNKLANVITGGNGSDILDGGSGNDGAADELRGGNGNDTYILHRAADVIVEEGSDDIDTVEVSFDYTLADKLEILRANGNGGYSLTGNASANTIMGGTGADRLDGGLGADLLRGGAGDDTYVVDGADTVEEQGGGGTDTVFASGNYALGDNIENLVATSAAAASLTGNASDNRITGNAGADTIDGGAGADVMQGSGGNDTYIVDNAGDQVAEASGNDGMDTVVSSVSFTLGAFLENLTASGSSAIGLTGNGGANTLTGNDAANVIDGGAGADVMRGGAGDDTYVLDQAGDQISDSAGTDTAVVSFTYALGADIENLTAAGGALSLGLTGNAFSNVITGTAGSDTLDGGAGADRLSGGDGNDTYVIDNAGDQVIDTGGTNTILTSVSFKLDASLTHLTGMGSGSLALTGNAADNSISGGAGSDKIYGGLGKDRLSGGAGKDFFVLDTAVAKKKNANADSVTDFNVKDDSIYLENAIFKALGKKGSAAKPVKLKKDAFFTGTKAHDADDRVIYNKKKGVLYYDADGTGGAAQIQIATLSKKLKVTEKDFFIV